MKLIAIVDKNWGIGKGGKALVTIPEDMKFFIQETTGKVVIMGRKTLESLPQAIPLKNRTNIVLTKNMQFTSKDAKICHSVEEVLDAVSSYPTEDIYIIGGESIYQQFMDYCDVAHITKVDYAYDADTHFPNLDKKSDWKITQMSEEKTYFDMIYEFVEYRRV
jgi:dihydrofolate reductase